MKKPLKSIESEWPAQNNGMDYWQIRAMLFGSLLQSVVDLCKEHFFTEPEAFSGIIEKMVDEAKNQGIGRKDFLKALTPELSDFLLKEMPRMDKARVPRRWGKLTTGERKILMFRYLLFYYFATTEFGVAKMKRMSLFKGFDLFARTRTCVERPLRKEVSDATAMLVAGTCLTKRQFRDLSGNLSRTKPKK